MTFLLLARSASDRGILVRDGFAGSDLEWSLSQLLAMGYVVVLQIRADSWQAARFECL